jgi:hypothetical protein
MNARRIKAAIAALYTLSVICFFAPVVWAIWDKFPLWRAQGGGGLAIGSGVVIVCAIVYMTFKNYITEFAREMFGTISAGISLIFLWFGLSIVMYAFASLATMLNDLSTVFLWAGIGATAGVALQCWARSLQKRIKEDDTDAH